MSQRIATCVLTISLLLMLTACKISFDGIFTLGGYQPAVPGADEPPLLTAITLVPSGKLSTPSYTFHSTKPGNILYGGSCSSAVSNAVAGNNTIVLTALQPGSYSDCTLQVRDADNNLSAVLAINSFVIELPFSMTGLLPIVQITPGSFLLVPGMEVQLSGFDWAADFTVQINGSAVPLTAAQPYERRFIMPSLPAGIYTLELSNSFGSMVLPVSLHEAVTTAQDFSAGAEHACMVINAGQVWCWGNNNYRQLGYASLSGSSQLVQVAGINNAVAVSAGEHHSCAVLYDDTVVCWGNNVSTPTLIAGVSDARIVRAGDDHSCVLRQNDQSVLCWSSAAPDQVLAGGAEDVDAGSGFACALMSDASVQCWGRNTLGQLGDGTTTTRNTAAPVNGLSNVVNISVGRQHACAVLNNGQLWCWGANTNGQLGDGTLVNRTLPVQVSGITNARSVSAGAKHTCAVLQDNSMRCWGKNSDGQLGDGSVDAGPLPVVVDDINDALFAYTGSAYSCAQLQSLHIACWGTAFRLGSDVIVSSIGLPVTVSSISAATAISGGGHHQCILLQGGTVQCRGNNNDGQLGSGKTSRDSDGVSQSVSAKFVTVSLADNAQAIATGASHTCAVLNSGLVYCWGANGAGQLGNGNNSGSSTPVLVSNLSNVQAISTGGSHSCAVQGGAVRCWGANANGQLGNNTTLNSNIWVEAGSFTDAVEISNGLTHSCTVLQGGAVYCWGANGSGQLGNGVVVDSHVPVAVSGLLDAVMVSSGNRHSCAVRLDGSVQCWGANSHGQLGNSSNTASVVPVNVNGISTAVSVSAGTNYSCAVLQDKTLHCWGSDGNTLLSSTPVQMPTPPNVAEVAITESQACILLDDGYVQCWGDIPELLYRGVIAKDKVYLP